MTLVDFAIRRRVTIAMATVAITLLGLISLSRLKVNLLPDLSYPTLTIRTELPGAAPTEIENLISRPSRKRRASCATCGPCVRCHGPASPT
jgi:HAE1 family hydrophobic/amphiphilic exporter-1